MIEFDYIQTKYDFKRDIQYVETPNGGIIISHGSKNGKLNYKNRVLSFLKSNPSWNLACCYPSKVQRNIPKEFKNRIILPSKNNSNYVVSVTWDAIDRKIRFKSIINFKIDTILPLTKFNFCVTIM